MILLDRRSFGCLHAFCSKYRKILLWSGVFTVLSISLWSFVMRECNYRFYSTSIHGGRPSSEYARSRKESLESEFGQTLGAYRSKGASVLYRFGAFMALYRAVIISFHVLNLTIWRLFVHDIRKRAVKVII